VLELLLAGAVVVTVVFATAKGHDRFRSDSGTVSTVISGDVVERMKLQDDIMDLPCPWCLAPTRENDVTCPSCGQRFG